MKLGQKVMLIFPIDSDIKYKFSAPAIGSIGEITTEIDKYDEYDVYFPFCEHPSINDPSWVVHKNWIVPIDDIGILQDEHEKLIELSDDLFASSLN